MPRIYRERMQASIEGDFVVFIIGMKINKPWKVHKWWPVFTAMPRMLKELQANPELGMLGHIASFRFTVQYWKSFEHLEAYARSKDHAHLPAWKAFNESVGNSGGDVGIWHETYRVRAGEYESVYRGMPRFGLAQAGSILPVTGATKTGPTVDTRLNS
ncbi:DUF4188 domain-containing protein [Halomonas kenyensis]|uniref:DUF4188 domain-containing protein n=2 Tax=Billgrantia kenyensis TaxID=321266 RepID=A0A7W0AFP6_9GAMM|nr:DUF4188 domain-containing protein [Halomonas kenyensis]MCG6661733.1 DUF4188 domain-containing protein [Halomonas kenyensis]